MYEVDLKSEFDKKMESIFDSIVRRRASTNSTDLSREPPKKSINECHSADQEDFLDNLDILQPT